MNYYFRDSKGEWHRISESSYRAMLAWRGDAKNPQLREIDQYLPTNRPSGLTKEGPVYNFSTEKVGRKKVQQ